MSQSNATLKLLSEKFLAHDWKCVTAESCTGGGLAYQLTRLAGSSQWFDRGIVTYSNQAKQDLLGVSLKTLSTAGAVSAETAQEMAEGALKCADAQMSVSITGVAGPGGGSKDKPVGTIWIAISSVLTDTYSFQLHLSGTRENIREQTIQIVLEKMLEFFSHLPQHSDLI